MSIKLNITYNGTTTAVEAGQTATLACSGKKMRSDLVFEVVDISLITFTIDGTEHQAVEGMTWNDWMADATYNTGGYECHVNLSDSVSDPDNGYCVVYDGNNQVGPLEIVDGYAYTTEYVNTTGE